MSAAQGGALPTVRVSADAARAVRHLRPWVWRKDVLEVAAAPGGWVVAVVDPRGQPAGVPLVEGCLKPGRPAFVVRAATFIRSG